MILPSEVENNMIFIQEWVFSNFQYQ